MFLCNENSLSLSTLVRLPFSLYLSAWPVPAARLGLRGEAWQADWPLAGWFGSLPKLCFPACLKLDLFPLLDFASVSNFSVVSLFTYRLVFFYHHTHTRTRAHTCTHTHTHELRGHTLWELKTCPT